jgi:hypothetical protein
VSGADRKTSTNSTVNWTDCNSSENTDSSLGGRDLQGVRGGEGLLSLVNNRVQGDNLIAMGKLSTLYQQPTPQMVQFTNAALARNPRSFVQKVQTGRGSGSDRGSRKQQRAQMRGKCERTIPMHQEEGLPALVCLDLSWSDVSNRLLRSLLQLTIKDGHVSRLQTLRLSHCR